MQSQFWQKFPRKIETARRLAEFFGVEINELVVIDDERFFELRKNRPVAERADELISELRELLMDDTKDREKRAETVQQLRALCDEFDLAGVNAAPPDSGEG